MKRKKNRRLYECRTTFQRLIFLSVYFSVHGPLTVVGSATKKWTEKLRTEKYDDDDGLRPEPKRAFLTAIRSLLSVRIFVSLVLFVAHFSGGKRATKDTKSTKQQRTYD